MSLRDRLFPLIAAHLERAAVDYGDWPMIHSEPPVPGLPVIIAEQIVEKYLIEAEGREPGEEG